MKFTTSHSKALWSSKGIWPKGKCDNCCYRFMLLCVSSIFYFFPLFKRVSINTYRVHCSCYGNDFNGSFAINNCVNVGMWTSTFGCVFPDDCCQFVLREQRLQGKILRKQNNIRSYLTKTNSILWLYRLKRGIAGNSDDWKRLRHKRKRQADRIMKDYLKRPHGGISLTEWMQNTGCRDLCRNMDTFKMCKVFDAA